MTYKKLNIKLERFDENIEMSWSSETISNYFTLQEVIAIRNFLTEEINRVQGPAAASSNFLDFPEKEWKQKAIPYLKEFSALMKLVGNHSYNSHLELLIDKQS